MTEVKYILIFGNVVEGLTFRGPFDTQEQALEYGEPIGEEWTITELTPPDLENQEDDDEISEKSS